MKLIKRHISSFLTSICSVLLSLLGFSCSSPEDVPDMYGTPTGDFEIKGAVTDESGNTVADAEIRVTHKDVPSGEYSFQTVTTDIEGKYIAEGQSYADPELKVVCIPSDTGLEADSVIVRMHYKKDKADSWYIGHAEETVNFKLRSGHTEK